MKAEKILLASPLLEYYLSEGLVVTQIYQIIEYAAETPFKSFLTQVMEARRKGDLDPSKVIIGDTYKLLANSSYGSLLMSREKHKNIKYFVSPARVQLYQNKPNFHATERLADDLFEVKMSKRSITENLPVHLGVYILQLAKLHMLRFYYNVLDTYVDRRHFQLLASDTDSLYFSLSEKSLDDVIKPDYRETYMKQIYHSCDDEYNDHPDYWFPRECCERHKTFDKKSPGKFKLEARGTCMIALNSKTYVLQQEKGGVKMSSKGLSHNALTDPFASYERTLSTGIPAGGSNTGFRVRNNAITTYKQFRQAISYFYVKRCVRNDGISTDPLTITLGPRPLRVCHDVVTSGHVLDPTRPQSLIFHQKSYPSLVHVLHVAVNMEDPENEIYQLLLPLNLNYCSLAGHTFVVSHYPRSAVNDPSLRKYYRQSIKYWTSGLQPEPSADWSPDKFPGKNRLGVVYSKLFQGDSWMYVCACVWSF